MQPIDYGALFWLIFVELVFDFILAIGSCWWAGAVGGGGKKSADENDCFVRPSSFSRSLSRAAVAGKPGRRA